MEVKTKYGPFELDGERILSAVERELERSLVPVIEEAVKIQQDDIAIFFNKGKNPYIRVTWSDEEFADVYIEKEIREMVGDEAEYPQEWPKWKETAEKLRELADYIEGRINNIQKQ